MDAEPGAEQEVDPAEYQQPAAAKGGEVADGVGAGSHAAAHLGAVHHCGNTKPDGKGFPKLRAFLFHSSFLLLTQIKIWVG